MKLFGRSGGYWLFWSGVLYLLLSVMVAFSPYRDYTMLVELVWFGLIALPLVCNPLARWLNMKENHMFDWFKSREERKEEYNNVVKFPEPKAVPEVPEEPEKPATTYYRLGITSNGRVSFQMGYSEITMNAGGVDNMIAQLEVFRDQILQYEDRDNNNDE
jgi:hypothetical protein